MRLHDRLYGEFDITEPVLRELLRSGPIQRLKRVRQFGPPERYYPVAHFSRYEHSIGVMLLLRLLGATVEEQVAGLLHDVAHTAFSHVGDYVFGTIEREDYHDDHFERFILDTEIKGILERHAFDVGRVMDEDRYPLLEQPAPSLCADRVDYALREAEDWADPGLSDVVVPDLDVCEGRIVFRTKDLAKRFGDAFLALQRGHWGNPEFVVRYTIFARALKRALEIDLISREDFHGDDDHLIALLEGSEDEVIRSCLSLLEEGPGYVWDDEAPEIDTKKKFRHVDPEVLVDGRPVPLSELDEEYKGSLERERARNEKGIRVRLR